MTSSLEIGEKLGLGMSPVTALAAVAAGDPCLLVIDQLDAVSFASGHVPAGFHTVVELIQEAVAFPGMRVPLACRGFDLTTITGFASWSQMRRSHALTSTRSPLNR